MQPNNEKTVNQPHGNLNHSNLNPATNRVPRTQISSNIVHQSTNQQQFQTLPQAAPQQLQFHQLPQQQQKLHLLSQQAPNQQQFQQIPQLQQQQQFIALQQHQQLQSAPTGPPHLLKDKPQQPTFNNLQQQQQQQPILRSAPHWQPPVNFAMPMYPMTTHPSYGSPMPSLPGYHPYNGVPHHHYYSAMPPGMQPHVYVSPPVMDSQLAAWKDEEDLLPVASHQMNKTENVHSADMLLENPKFLLADALKLDAVLQSDNLLHSDSARIIPVMVSLKETLLNDAQIDTKADIVCIIDVSGSMAGSKLDNVKSTMKLLLELLPGSRLAIVLFGTNAQLWMNFKTVNSDNTPKIIKVIDFIVDKDSTNITAGLHRAQNLLGNRKTKNQVSSMFLLSDGQHNQGKIDNNILFDGDMGRTQAEYSLHTFGYGDDHDAKLMQSMAERKGGNYYFVQDIKKVDECFLDCLGMVSTMLATKGVAKINIIPTALYPEIRIVNTYGTYLKKLSDTHAILEIPTIYAGMRKDYIFDVEFESTKKRLTASQLLEVIKVEFECVDIAAASGVKLSKSVTIKALPAGSQEAVFKNLDVTKNYLRVKTGDVLEKVEQLQLQRKHTEALGLLKSLDNLLEQELELQGDPLITSLKQQVAQIVKMVTNDSRGVHNEFKTSNYVAQQRNVYMNQQSAPQFAQQMYANSRQSQNADFARSRKS